MHFIVSFLLLTGLSWKNLIVNPAPARVYEQQLTIPTYELGRENINPPLWNERVYPYPLQDDILNSKLAVHS